MNYTKLNAYNLGAEKISSYDAGLRVYMISVYKYMALALALTGFISWFVASSPALMNAIFSGPMMWIVMLAPLAMVLFISARFIHMSTETVKMCLWAYAALMGVSMASIFIIYTGTSIARTFFITSSVFGAMSIYGYTTKKDLSAFSSFFIMGLFGIIIASLVNIFMQSDAITFITSILGIAIFCFLTAYDTQNLKSIYYQVADDAGPADKVAVFGALSLYLNFINLFMKLLYFFGDRRS